MAEEVKAKPPAGDKGEKERGPRNPRQVRAAATILVKEGRRILKKHAGRIAREPVEAIRSTLAEVERSRAARDWGALERSTEELDELLHTHASFARKSALRETFENVAVAVLVALGLRSCVYEPFKIPSGSMMPTLRSGDHIFVNKFVYGIQIPFTNTVVGESLGEIRRGDVVVFRYPIDESEDFIKRVIGLPGDTIRVDGDAVSIRRAGEESFEVLERRQISEPCRDEGGERLVSGCALYEETLDGRTYVVRYLGGDARLGIQRRKGEWQVPEGRLLVMGDNRNQSHDSLVWTRTVEAVNADGLLTIKDLRDLTGERLFSLARPDDPSRQDPKIDHVVYKADHRSPPHDLELEVWRQPSLGASAIYAAAVAAMKDQDPRETSFTAIVDASPLHAPGGKRARARERLIRQDESITAMTLGRDEVAFTAALHLGEADATIRLRCGVAACRDEVEVIERLATILAAFEHNRDQDARQLLEGDRALRYSQHWTSRSPERFVDRTFRSPTSKGDDDVAASVRLRVWRQPDEGEAMVREAALIALAGGPEAAAAAPDLGADAWLSSDDKRVAIVSVDPSGVVFVFECGRQLCRQDSYALGLAGLINDRVPAAARDRRALGELLAASDLGDGWTEDDPPPPPTRYEYDRIRLEGTERSLPYSVAIWIWLRPEDGLAAASKRLADAVQGAEPDDAIASGGYVGESVESYTMIFGIPSTDALIQIECRKGLCPTRDAASAIARRVAEKALDRDTFIDPAAERPSPFVPRGNVKGRADRIWLPLRRFWLPIR